MSARCRLKTEEVKVKTPKPVKTYKIDEFTTIQKLDNGVELVVEDYSKERDALKGTYPAKIYRQLHPGGRQDCHMVMNSACRTKSKQLKG